MRSSVQLETYALAGARRQGSRQRGVGAGVDGGHGDERVNAPQAESRLLPLGDLRATDDRVDRAGLPETAEPVEGRRSRVFSVPFTAEGGAEAMTAMADDLPQAVVVLSSRLVMGVLRECGKRELAIPGDLSVAGLGDPEWFAIWRPGITTYAPPLAAMGQRAAETLLKLMSNTDEHDEPETVLLPGELRIRGSVAGLHN